MCKTISIPASLVLLASVASADPITNGLYGSIGAGVAYEYNKVVGHSVNDSKGGVDLEFDMELGFALAKLVKAEVNVSAAPDLFGRGRYPRGYPEAAPSVSKGRTYIGDVNTQAYRAEFLLGVNILKIMGISDKTLYLTTGTGYYGFYNSYNDSGTGLSQFYTYVPIKLEGENAINQQMAVRYGVFYNRIYKARQLNGDLTSSTLHDLNGNRTYEWGAKMGYAFYGTPQSSLGGYVDVVASYAKVLEKPAADFKRNNFKAKLVVGLKFK